MPSRANKLLLLAIQLLVAVPSMGKEPASTTTGKTAPKKVQTKTVKATVIDMISSEYGGLRVFAAPNMVKVKFRAGGELHAMAPKWTVVCSNPNDKTIIEVPWEKWKSESFPTLVDLRRDHFTSPSTRLSKTTLLNRAALKITAPFSIHSASAILPPRSASIRDVGIDKKPDTISITGTDLHLGTKETELLSHLLKVPTVIGFPLRISCRYSNGYSGVTVDTNSITTEVFPISFFAAPTGYPNKVRTPEMAIAGQQLERAFQGLLDDAKNDK